MYNAWEWKRVSAKKPIESLPVHARSLRAAIKPLSPSAPHFVQKASECSTVPSDTEVVVVTAHLGNERFMLLADRPMAVSTTPLGDALKRAPEAVARGLTLHHPVALPGSAPEVGEAKHIEAPGTVTMTGRSSEIDELGLLWMEGEPELGESLRKDVHHPSCIRFSREDHRGVVGISDQTRRSIEPRPHLALEPDVKDFVQVHVRKQRRDHAALRSAAVRTPNGPIVLHACTQPLVDRSSKHSVAYPLIKDSSEMSVPDAVEEVADVDLDHPATAYPHRRIPQRLQRLVCGPTWAEPVRAGQEVLLVNGIQHHRDRPLKHFIFKRRDSKGTRCPVSLGDFDSPDRWRVVRARLEAIEQ